MESSFLTEIIMPLVIMIIMFGMGLTLEIKDFTRFLSAPTPVIAGIIGQILVLPCVAFSVAILLDLPPIFAIGLVLIGACPGATTSNVFSQLSRANLALSISLTATSAVLCIITAPFIVSLALSTFAQETVEFSVIKTSAGVFFVSLMPVMFGMLVYSRSRNIALKIEPYFRRLSALVILLFVIVLLYNERAVLLGHFAELAVATFLLNIITIIAGVSLAYLFQLSDINRLTLGIEVGVQNTALAIFIATSFIGDIRYSYPALVYSVTMYIGVFTFIFVHKKLVKKNGHQTKIYDPQG